jgi:Tfp pilus assembly protein PilF
MFCHNSYPEVPAGSDTYDAPQTFPKELPRGLGCQRCHGPGDAHVRLSFDLDANEDDIRAAIWNPLRLEPARQDEVCLQCHLQPTVALSGLRQFHRPIYSYRPDQPLDDYLVYLDAVEERPREERFEINHHPYRLHQSRCFQESQGALSCLTCHDAHHKPQAEAAKAHFRDACLSCHQQDDCQLEEMTQHATAEGLSLPEGVAADDCVACHMPRRRTQDVVQATMTDHLIRRRPGGPELTAPIPEEPPHLTAVSFLRPERAPQESLGEVYRHLVMVRNGDRSAIPLLRTALAEAKPEHAAPYLELATGELSIGKPVEAEASLNKALELDPELIAARLMMGAALASQGNLEGALEHLEWAFEKAPERPEVRFNLGKILLHLRRLEEAISHFEAAVEARPYLEAGWVELGNAHAASRNLEEAIRSYRQALAVDPRQETVRKNLVLCLMLLKRQEEARAELEAWLHFQPENDWARNRLMRLPAPTGASR